MISCSIVVINRVFDDSNGRSSILIIYLMNNLYISRAIKFILNTIEKIIIIIFLLFSTFISTIFTIIIIIIIIIFIFFVLVSIISLICYYIMEWIIRSIIISKYTFKRVYIDIPPIWVLSIIFFFFGF